MLARARGRACPVRLYRRLQHGWRGACGIGAKQLLFLVQVRPLPLQRGVLGLADVLLDGRQLARLHGCAVLRANVHVLQHGARLCILLHR